MLVRFPASAMLLSPVGEMAVETHLRPSLWLSGDQNYVPQESGISSVILAVGRKPEGLILIKHLIPGTRGHTDLIACQIALQERVELRQWWWPGPPS